MVYKWNKGFCDEDSVVKISLMFPLCGFPDAYKKRKKNPEIKYLYILLIFYNITPIYRMMPKSHNRC